MQMQLLYEHFPESPWVSHFKVHTKSYDNVFSIEYNYFVFIYDALFYFFVFL